MSSAVPWAGGVGVVDGSSGPGSAPVPDGSGFPPAESLPEPDGVVVLGGTLVLGGTVVPAIEGTTGCPVEAVVAGVAWVASVDWVAWMNA